MECLIFKERKFDYSREHSVKPLNEILHFTFLKRNIISAQIISLAFNKIDKMYYVFVHYCTTVLTVELR